MTITLHRGTNYVVLNARLDRMRSARAATEKKVPAATPSHISQWNVTGSSQTSERAGERARVLLRLASFRRGARARSLRSDRNGVASLTEAFARREGLCSAEGLHTRRFSSELSIPWRHLAARERNLGSVVRQGAENRLVNNGNDSYNERCLLPRSSPIRDKCCH